MKIIRSAVPPPSIIESYRRKAGVREILLAEGAQLVIPAPAVEKIPCLAASA